MNHRRVTIAHCLLRLVLAALLVSGCRLFPPHQAEFDAVRDLSGGLAVFPGAEGFGSTTRAGRGGDIIRVTNLSNAGAGSLREALQREGARIVVFEVGGTIELDSPIVVHHPFLTLAGQTAPNPGITLTGSGIVISTHDVLVQHIRSRPGDGPVGTAPENRDGISVIGNLFAHNVRRNPLLKGDTSSFVANNVIYNPGTEAIGFSDPEWSGRSIATIVDNLFIPGADTAGSEFVRRGLGTSGDIELFLEGNRVRNGALVDFVPPPRVASVRVSSAPVWVEPFESVAVSELESVVLSGAGARPASRDPVDERIVQSVQNRTGTVIDSQTDVGGYPASAPTSIPLSIPENPHQDDNSNGYTNVEEWLHSLGRGITFTSNDVT